MEDGYKKYIFKNANISDLEAMYWTFQTAENDAGITTPTGKMFADNVLSVCDELERRGEGQRVIFLLLLENLQKIDTEELQDFHKLLANLTKATEGSILADHYTECGDPISDAAGIFECFLWFLQEELKRRGVNWRAVYSE